MADFGLDPTFPYLHAIDAPRPGDPAATFSVPLRGWVLVPSAARVRLEVVHGADSTPLVVRERPDVVAHLGGGPVVAFDQLVPVPETVGHDGGAWHLLLGVDDVEHRLPLPVDVVPGAVATMRRAQAAKLRLIEPVLRCPARSVTGRGDACLGVLSRDGSHLACTRCGAAYVATDAGVDFLATDAPERDVDVRSEDVSALTASTYDRIAEPLITRHQDGLILDCGAGLKHVYRENIVYFDIADYPTTDVRGVGESLPFADDTFDLVLSLAVLEHVRDPFRCAREIVRVLKPGGQVYAAVPFLQPYHGYPNHYYNMTLSGLENLFAECRIEESGTPEYGLPIWTLCWFLDRYLAGLPPDVAERFGDLRVRDLVAQGPLPLGRDYIAGLDPATRTELASVNFLIATKAPPDEG